MNIKLLSHVSFYTLIVCMSGLAEAREIVVLPGVVGAVGIVSGVDTQGPGTLTVGTQDINTGNDAGGGITTSAANTANIQFTGTSIVTGIVGTTGATFLNIDAGASGNTVTFNGSVFSTTSSVTGTGTVNFNGGYTSNTGGTMDFAGDGFITVAAGQTVKAAITNTAGANTGTLSLGANSILDGAVGAASGLKNIAVVGGNALITGAANSTSFTLGTNTLNVAGALIIPTAGVINTTIFSPSLYGNITPVGAATIGTALQVNVNVTGLIANGSSYNIVNATSGTSGSTVIATDNSARYQFSAAPTTNGLVQIVTTQIPLPVVIAPPPAPPPPAPPPPAPPPSPPAPPVVPVVVVPPVVAPIIVAIAAPPVVPVVVNPVAISVASIVDTLPITTTTTPLLTAITLLPTPVEVASALSLLGVSTTTLASPQMNYNADQRFQQLLTSHLDAIEKPCTSDDQKKFQLEYTKGCQSSNMRSHVWGSVFGYTGAQGNSNGFEGYDFNSEGIMIGYDIPLNKDTLAGVGMRYAQSNLDGAITNNNNEINSYQATGYFAYAPGPWFANANLVVGIDNYSGSRQVVFQGFDNTAKSDYNGNQYTAAATTGYHFYLNNAKTIITPLASLQYTRMHTSAYTETGGDAIDLHVDAQDYNFVQSGLGVKIAHDITLPNMQVLRPDIHASWLYSLGDNTMENSATFTNGGTSFTTAGQKSDRSIYNVGAGVVLASSGAWSTEGVYDYQWSNNGYRANQATINFVLHL